uniref:SAS-6_N domain-containing protein n=1 Tax=Steinernema glaseri TaxID=37863 RepID=A0A1I7Z2Z0_9BILA
MGETAKWLFEGGNSTESLLVILSLRMECDVSSWHRTGIRQPSRHRSNLNKLRSFHLSSIDTTNPRSTENFGAKVAFLTSSDFSGDRNPAVEMIFDEAIAVQLSDNKQRNTGNELTSVYVKQIDFRLQIYERSNGSELVVDLAEEGEPRSVYRVKIDERKFKEIAAEQRIRTGFDKFPEIIVSFARQAKEHPKTNFFSCRFPVDADKSLRFELTQHGLYNSSSILTLKMNILEGEELIEYLTNVIKKELKFKDEINGLKQKNHDLLTELNKCKQEKQAAVQELRNGRTGDDNVEHLKYEMQKLQDKNEDLQEEVKIVTDKIEQLKMDYENLESTHKDEEILNEELAIEVEKLEMEVADLKEQLDVLDSEYNGLKKEHTELTHGYREVYTEYEKGLETEQKLASTLARVAEEKYTILEENKQLQAQNQRLAVKCEDNRKKLQKLAVAFNVPGSPRPVNGTP